MLNELFYLKRKKTIFLFIIKYTQNQTKQTRIIFIQQAKGANKKNNSQKYTIARKHAFSKQESVQHRKYKCILSISLFYFLI